MILQFNLAFYLSEVYGPRTRLYAQVTKNREVQQVPAQLYKFIAGTRNADLLQSLSYNRFGQRRQFNPCKVLIVSERLVYRSVVKIPAPTSYLAAAADTVGQHTDLLRSKGVGVIGATNDGVTRWSSPPTSESHEHVVDIEGQLSVRLRRIDIAGDIASLSLAQLLNYLAPVVAVDQHGPLVGDELADVLEAEYGFRAGTQARRSALSLGLLEGSDRFTLTDQGELAATVLRGCGISTLEDLDAVKSDVGRSTVVGEHQPLAILLRNCYERHPEFRLLLDALRKEGPEIHFPDLIRRLVHEYPNVFLNTFCTQSGRTRARELIETGQTTRIYEEEAVWKDIIQTNVLFNFVQQLKHIGVLDAATRSHSGKISEYDPDAKPWVLREDR